MAVNEKRKKYREEHQDLIREQQRRYRKRNWDKVYSTQRKYRALHVDLFIECRRKWVERNREKVAASRIKSAKKSMEKHPEKHLARLAVKRALVSGKLKRPDYCHRCGLICTPHAHHPDYSKPLEILWRCLGCHLLEHGKILRPRRR